MISLLQNFCILIIIIIIFLLLFSLHFPCQINSHYFKKGFLHYFPRFSLVLR